MRPKRHLVDDPAQPAVVVGVAGPQHVDPLDHRRVVGPAVVVLEQRPDPGRRVGHLERVAVLAHGVGPVARLAQGAGLVEPAVQGDGPGVAQGEHLGDGRADAVLLAGR